MTYVVYMLSMGSFILGVYEINRSKERRLRDFISEENLKKRLIEVRGIVFKRYLEKKRMLKLLSSLTNMQEETVPANH